MKKHRSFTVKCNTVVVIHVVVAAVVKVRERGGSVVWRRTPELEINGSNLQECRLVFIEQKHFRLRQIIGTLPRK